MQAVREIREMTTPDLVITLPPEFVRKQVEIMVLCVESNATAPLIREENNDWERDLEVGDSTAPQKLMLCSETTRKLVNVWDGRPRFASNIE